MTVCLGDRVVIDPAAVLIANWDGKDAHVRLRAPNGGEYSFPATEAEWQAFRNALEAATLVTANVYQVPSCSPSFGWSLPPTISPPFGGSLASMLSRDLEPPASLGAKADPDSWRDRPSQLR